MFGPIFSASFQQSIVRFLHLDESIRLVQIAESSLSALLLEIQHINPKNADLLSSLVLLRMDIQNGLWHCYNMSLYLKVFYVQSVPP